MHILKRVRELAGANGVSYNMPEEEIGGAALPEGILVDETSAYFGITQSSNLLMELEQIDRISAVNIVLQKLEKSLLVEKFNLDELVELLNVEGGEIYYLLSGTFGIMDTIAPLQNYINLNKTTISGEDITYLQMLTDPLNILKIMSVGYIIGQEQEVAGYSEKLDAIMNNSSQNISVLISIAKQLLEIFSMVKEGINVTPISELSGGPSSPHVTSSRLTVSPTVNESEAIEEQVLQEPIVPTMPEPVPLMEPIVPTMPEPVPLIEPTKSEIEAMEQNQIQPEIIEENNEIQLPEIEQKIISPIRKPITQKVEKENVSIHPPTPLNQNDIDIAKPQTRIKLTIESGVNCPRCEIGVYTNWKHCPVCGAQISSNSRSANYPLS